MIMNILFNVGNGVDYGMVIDGGNLFKKHRNTDRSVLAAVFLYSELSGCEGGVGQCAKQG